MFGQSSCLDRGAPQTLIDSFVFLKVKQFCTWEKYLFTQNAARSNDVYRKMQTMDQLGLKWNFDQIHFLFRIQKPDFNTITWEKKLQQMFLIK